MSLIETVGHGDTCYPVFRCEVCGDIIVSVLDAKVFSEYVKGDDAVIYRVAHNRCGRREWGDVELRDILAQLYANYFGKNIPMDDMGFYTGKVTPKKSFTDLLEHPNRNRDFWVAVKIATCEKELPLPLRPESPNVDEHGLINWSNPMPEPPEITAWDEAYVNECDRLASIAAAYVTQKKNSRQWGRWYLDTEGRESLNTLPVRAPVGEGAHTSLGQEYWIDLNTCKTPKDVKNWEKHMRDKGWIGEQGHNDLAQAFDQLKKEGKVAYEPDHNRKAD